MQKLPRANRAIEKCRTIEGQRVAWLLKPLNKTNWSCSNPCCRSAPRSVRELSGHFLTKSITDATFWSNRPSKHKKIPLQLQPDVWTLALKVTSPRMETLTKIRMTFYRWLSCLKQTPLIKRCQFLAITTRGTRVIRIWISKRTTRAEWWIL